MSKPLRVFFLGDDNPQATSLHRAQAMRRLGCEVEVINPSQAFNRFRIHPKINYLTGDRFIAPLVHRWLKRQIVGKQFDLVWVDNRSVISGASISLLKKNGLKVIYYSVDDPTGTRDGNRWDTFRKSIPYYDLCAVVRVESEQEFRQLGGGKTLRVWRSYDEVAHEPFATEEAIPSAFRSEVAFIGTWMRGEGRDHFLVKLLEAGIAVSIWGKRWEKSPLWSKIKAHRRGGSLGGRDYVAAMQGAKICLGFLSKGNRDLHTQRSSETAYAGGLFCAERTSEHLQMFQEGVEAVFWSSAEECIQVCRELLSDESRRQRIREAGMKRIRALGLGNEIICRKILCELGHGSFENSTTRRLLRLQSVFD
jgi:spore maturation protein CgeB